MIAELAAVAAVLIAPAMIILGTLAAIGLSVAGLASADLDEPRLLRG